MPLQDFPLVEPYGAPEFAVHGIGRIERFFGQMRFTFYSLQRPAGGGPEDIERVVKVYIILPVEAVAPAAMQAMAAADAQVFLDKTH